MVCRTRLNHVWVFRSSGKGQLTLLSPGNTVCRRRPPDRCVVTVVGSLKRRVCKLVGSAHIVGIGKNVSRFANMLIELHSRALTDDHVIRPSGAEDVILHNSGRSEEHTSESSQQCASRMPSS